LLSRLLTQAHEAQIQELQSKHEVYECVFVWSSLLLIIVFKIHISGRLERRKTFDKCRRRNRWRKVARFCV